MSVSGSRVLSTSSLPSNEARWVTLQKTTYIDPNGVERTWESAERLTRPAGVDFDGVGICAILRRANKPPALLLQRQFRPPIAKVTVELPAGLVDEGETPEQCALRELYEETGYKGEIAGIENSKSPLMFNDPGMCNTNLFLVHVEVDCEAEVNKNPKQMLEENEFIECFEIELGEALEREYREWTKKGWAVDARVGTLIEGWELARRFAAFAK